jgi:hypothetical protein
VSAGLSSRATERSEGDPGPILRSGGYSVPALASLGRDDDNNYTGVQLPSGLRQATPRATSGWPRI